MDSLEAKTKKTENGCWEWQRSFRNGYGAIKYKGKTRGAHRVSYCLTHDEDIDGDFNVCHHCDNRKCINPKHLFKGTQSDNMKDAFLKGRIKLPINAVKFLKGHIPVNRKIKEPNEIIKAIRFRKISLKDIALKFDISYQAARDISCGRAYKLMKEKCVA